MLEKSYLGTENGDIRGKRILYLTEDPTLIEQQLAGVNLEFDYHEKLLDRLSTDTFPTRACFRFDPDHMGDKALTGLSLGNDRWVPDNAIREGSFGVIVAGKSFGCGSSREHFPWSLKAAGIRLVIADSVERICAQNCQNIGLPYIEGRNGEILSLLKQEGYLPSAEITRGLDQVSQEIVLRGGLFPFLNHYGEDLGKFRPETACRPMTAAEKIIARKMGVRYVKPGDVGFFEADRLFSHEIFAPFSASILRNIPGAKIKQPDSVYLFYDHSVLDTAPDAVTLGIKLREFAVKEGLTLFDGDQEQGTEGICHTIMLEKFTKPGEAVVGTDSHTPHQGAVGAFAWGVGSTEWAGALLSNKVRLCVPPSIRIELSGRLPQGTMAKDVMLHLLSQRKIRDGEAIGKIFEYAGSALDHLLFDEQVVLTNMVSEGGGATGFIAINPNSLAFILAQHHLSDTQLGEAFCFSDPGAEYSDEFNIDVSRIEPYVALPGDPCSGMPFSSLSGDTHIDTAFIGSCTGAKLFDIATAAKILSGKRIHRGITLFVQPSSQAILRQAQEAGYIDAIKEAGGTILPSACGACVNFGPGSVEKGQRVISSTNRNFKGRMGAGEAFLASPAVVAATALAGKISLP